MILGHKWEYLTKATWQGGKARGCLRCDKREAQVAELAMKYPNYWHHIDWGWSSFKEFEKEWEKRKRECPKLTKPRRASRQDYSRFFKGKGAKPLPHYRRAVKGKKQPEED